MTFRGYMDTFRRRWLLIATCVVVCLGGAIALTLSATPMYQSQVQLFVSAQPSGDLSNAAANLTNVYQGGLFTQQRVQSYVDVANSPSVTKPVINSLHLALTPSQLAKKISANAPNNTVLIYVYAQDRSPLVAQHIANAAASSFISFVNILEKPVKGGPSPVHLSISYPATLPTSPVSPKKTLNITLGFVLGLSLGLGLALLRERMDTTVKDIDELEHAHHVTALGVISYDKQVSRTMSSGVVETSQRAEALRQLRTNLQFINLDNPPDCLVVTSSLPSEGKTTTTCGLAMVMAEAGLNVVVVEGDLRHPKIGEYLSLPPSEGLTTALLGKRELSDLLHPVGKTGRLHVLLAGIPAPNPSELLASNHMESLLQTLRERFDMVLIDAPPLLPVTDGAILAAKSSGAIVVVRHGKTRHHNLDTALESLRKVDAKVLGVILNMVPHRAIGYYGYGYGYEPAVRPDEAEPAVVPEQAPTATVQ